MHGMAFSNLDIRRDHVIAVSLFINTLASLPQFPSASKLIYKCISVELGAVLAPQCKVPTQPQMQTAERTERA